MKSSKLSIFNGPPASWYSWAPVRQLFGQLPEAKQPPAKRIRFQDGGPGAAQAEKNEKAEKAENNRKAKYSRALVSKSFSTQLMSPLICEVRYCQQPMRKHHCMKLTHQRSNAGQVQSPGLPQNSCVTVEPITSSTKTTDNRIVSKLNVVSWLVARFAIVSKMSPNYCETMHCFEGSLLWQEILGDHFLGKNTNM